MLWIVYHLIWLHLIRWEEDSGVTL
jgi:hypothetical protein